MENSKFLTMVKGAITALEQQKVFGVNGDDDCQYHAPETGHRCVIGHMMPLDVCTHADSFDESDLPSLNIEWLSQFNGRQKALLEELQSEHDMCAAFSEVVDDRCIREMNEIVLNWEKKNV